MPRALPAAPGGMAISRPAEAGRRAGSVPGFAYSAAMKKSSIVWNKRTLDRFLASPLAVIPGTAMGYAGIADPRERADLIEYLERANHSPPCAG